MQNMASHAITVMANRYLIDERKAQAARETPCYRPV